VYAAGFSHGGIMALRLAIESPETFAAVGTVAASLPVQLTQLPAPALPTPVAMINSIDDPVLPFEGGRLIFRGFEIGNMVSVPDSIGYWVEVNGANAEPLVDALPDIATYDNCTVQRGVHQGDAPVARYTISGGGHSWPGGPQQFEEAARPVCYDIKATDVLLEFFAQFSRATD
jgi:polyhydroxybutyrate depolymerase